MKEYICIDIGGTSIKYGMIREKDVYKRQVISGNFDSRISRRMRRRFWKRNSKKRKFSK